MNGRQVSTMVPWRKSIPGLIAFAGALLACSLSASASIIVAGDYHLGESDSARRAGQPRQCHDHRQQRQRQQPHPDWHG